MFVIRNKNHNMTPVLSVAVASQGQVSGLRSLFGVGSRVLEDVDLENRNVVKTENNQNWRRNNWLKIPMKSLKPIVPEAF